MAVPISVRIKGHNGRHGLTFIIEADNPCMSSVGGKGGFGLGQQDCEQHRAGRRVHLRPTELRSEAHSPGPGNCLGNKACLWLLGKTRLLTPASHTHTHTQQGWRELLPPPSCSKWGKVHRDPYPGFLKSLTQPFLAGGSELRANIPLPRCDFKEDLEVRRGQG